MPSGVYNRTEEAKKKISESHKGKPGFWKGKHFSEETKKKIYLKIKIKTIKEVKKNGRTTKRKKRRNWTIQRFSTKKNCWNR
jgi:hypothetical protein